eukprot:scaffold73894_cov15-Tisochrysis_lutea.AAC.1
MADLHVLNSAVMVATLGGDTSHAGGPIRIQSSRSMRLKTKAGDEGACPARDDLLVLLEELGMRCFGACDP